MLKKVFIAFFLLQCLAVIELKAQAVVYDSGVVEPFAESKKGFLDYAGIYKLVETNSRNYLDSKCGVIDSAGKTVLPVIFSMIQKKENFYLVKFEQLYGVFDNKFKQVLPFEFSRIDKVNGRDLFIVNYAQPSLNKRGTGIIDSKNNVILDSKYRNIHPLNRYYNNQYNAIDSRKQLLIIEHETAERTALYSLNTMKFVSSFVYKSIYYTDFGIIVTQPNNQRQLLDFNLNPTFRITFDNVQSYERSNTAIITKDLKKGLVNFDGRIILPVIYDNITPTNSYDNAYFIVTKGENYEVVNSEGAKQFVSEKIDWAKPHDMKEGLIHIKKSGKQGLFSTTLKQLTDCIYDTVIIGLNMYLGKLNNGYELIKTGTKTKKYIELDNVDIYYGDYIIGTKNKKKVIYNANGDRVLANTNYDEAINYSNSSRNNFFLVAENNKWGMISEEGDIILPLTFQKITAIYYHYLLIRQNDKFGVFDLNTQKFIQTCECNAISETSKDRNKYACLKDMNVSYFEVER